MDNALPAIPAKRYFTIGEVSELCGVKPYVLRYWEQEFAQLKPMKRRGNRRYYQHHEVLLIRRIRELLYDQGFTISGARNRLAEGGLAEPPRQAAPASASVSISARELQASAAAREMGAPINGLQADAAQAATIEPAASLMLAAEPFSGALTPEALRAELMLIRELLH